MTTTALTTWRWRPDNHVRPTNQPTPAIRDSLPCGKTKDLCAFRPFTITDRPGEHGPTERLPSRAWLTLQRHDPAPPLTTSCSAFPASNVGDVDADIETASPVLGLRPVRASLFLVPKLPSPPESRGPHFLAIGESVADRREHTVHRLPGHRLDQARSGCQPTCHLRLVHPVLLPDNLPRSWWPSAPSRIGDPGQIQQSAVRWEGQPVTALMVPCAETRPIAIAEAAALGDISPCQSLQAQLRCVLVMLSGLDDMRLSCHATRSRAVLLRPAGSVERAPALGIGTQARSEHLLADANHERLDRRQR